MSNNYRSEAQRRWRKAIWVEGNGRYATVAHCGHGTSVMLHVTQADALHAKQTIDQCGCGGGCRNFHFIRDLDK